ncbi:17500_t:CDS:2, partial [Funneliformis caledonium]
EYYGLRKQQLVEFMHRFTLISWNFKEMYQMINLGENSEFERCDNLDPFSK